MIQRKKHLYVSRKLMVFIMVLKKSKYKLYIFSSILIKYKYTIIECRRVIIGETSITIILYYY